jgi:hypothetical protein
MNKKWIAASMGIAIVLLATVSCTDKRDTPTPVVQVEPVPCQKVGDVCALRPPRKSALAYSAQKWLIKDSKNPGGSPDEIGLINGRAILILYAVQVRILRLTDQGTEAVVVRDMWDIEPDSAKRRGNRMDGNKIWIDNTQWVVADGK